MRLHLGGLCRIAAASLLCVGFAAKPTMAQIVPIDVVGNFGSFNEYNTNFAPQTYKDWGNEPFVAVNPLNTSQIVVSGFGFGSPNANYYYSTDAGTSWGSRFAVTTPVTGVSVPNDQVFVYDKTGTLHAIMLGSDSSGNTNIYHGSTAKPGLRIAADAAGNVYSVFGIGTAKVGGVETVTYRLNRNTDFTNANGGPGGLVIDGGQSAQFGSSFGGINQLQGNTTSIAVSQAAEIEILRGKQRFVRCKGEIRYNSKQNGRPRTLLSRASLFRCVERFPRCVLNAVRIGTEH